MVVYNKLPLVDQETQASDDATFQEDLPTKGGLSGIDLMFRVSNATGQYGAGGLNILDILEEVKIVVNGDVNIFALSGPELFRHAWVRDGKPPWYEFNERNSEYQYVNVPIRFGRYLGDPLYGMKLSAFQNAQIVVDHNVTPVTAGDSVANVGYVSGSLQVNAQLHVTPADKEPAYRGTIGTREFYTYSTTANEEKRIELPTQHPYVGVGVYLHKDATWIYNLIDKVRFSLDNDEKQPIRGRWRNHVMNTQEMLDVETLVYLANVGDLGTLDNIIDHVRSIQIKPGWTDIGDTGTILEWNPTFALSGSRLTWAAITEKTMAAADGGAISAAERSGNAPFDVMIQGDLANYIYWPFGDRMLLDELHNPALYSKNEVVLEVGSTGSATAAMIVEELRPVTG